MATSSQQGSSYEPQQKNLPLEAGDLIISYLEQLGVEYVFGIPGGAIEPFYNALARSERRGGPRAVVARHESGAAFMADGYYRETGKLGVCCATTGPGATNMITGVASAYEDNIPLLIITAQSPLSTFGKGAVQESSCTSINTVGMFHYCTRYNSLVSHIDQLEHKLVSAILTAYQSPKGPVHLSIPLDLLRSPVSIRKPSTNLVELIHESQMCDKEAVSKLSKLVDEAEKIIIVIGEGCVNAIGHILEFARIHNTTIITTPQGKGLVSSYHPQFKGVFGVGGHQSANKELLNPSVDLVLAIGTSLDQAATNGWDEHSIMNNKLVHIDSINKNFTRSQVARLHVKGNISSVFELLLTQHTNGNLIHSFGLSQKEQEKNRGRAPVIKFERRSDDRRLGERHGNHRNRGKSANISILKQMERRSADRRNTLVIPENPKRQFSLSDENKYFTDTVPIKPQRLMYYLAHLFPPNTRFLAEIGNSFLWAIHYLHPINRRVTGLRQSNSEALRVGMGFSSMGWAIGGAVGTALGCKGEPVVCITGDGSMLMSGQEITVAVQENLPVIYVVLNDSAYGTVKHGQRMAGAESIGYDLPKVDFKILAQSMGVQSFSIYSPQDMLALNIESICKHRGPTLLDVYIDPNENPPLGERLAMLASG